MGRCRVRLIELALQSLRSSALATTQFTTPLLSSMFGAPVVNPVFCTQTASAGLQMRVVLNASSLMCGTMFSIANVWGMNLWSGPTRLNDWPHWTFIVVRLNRSRFKLS